MPAWISPGSTEARAARGNALREGLNAAVRRLPVWSVYALGILPGLIYLGLGLTDRLGPDPVNVLVRALGLWALRFLVLGLAVTPLRDWTGISLLRHRRALGLLAFFYALAHLAAYAGLDQGLDWAAIGRETLKRPYITIGMAAALLLLPLALTSTDRAIRRMGATAAAVASAGLSGSGARGGAFRDAGKDLGDGAAGLCRSCRSTFGRACRAARVPGGPIRMKPPEWRWAPGMSEPFLTPPRSSRRPVPAAIRGRPRVPHAGDGFPGARGNSRCGCGSRGRRD